jgi:putative transposase
MASRNKPDDVYAARQGGGASIPDYFSDVRGESPQGQTGQRCSAAIEEMGLA